MGKRRESRSWGSLEHPQRMGWEFDIVVARIERGGRISADRKILAREHKLPSLAEIHRRLELHFQAGGAGPRCTVHTLNADDAGRFCPASRFRPRHATQSLTEQLYRCTAAGI